MWIPCRALVNALKKRGGFALGTVEFGVIAFEIISLMASNGNNCSSLPRMSIKLFRNQLQPSDCRCRNRQSARKIGFDRVAMAGKNSYAPQRGHDGFFLNDDYRIAEPFKFAN
jgi:hypothetical protein